MNDLSGRLLWAFLQMSAVGLVGLLISTSLGRRRPAARALALATTLVAMLVTSGLAFSPWSRWYAAPRWLSTAAVQERLVLRGPALTPEAANTDSGAAAPLTDAPQPAEPAASSAGLAGESLASRPPRAARAARAIRRSTAISPATGVLFVIALGTTASLAWWVVGLVSLTRLWAGSHPVDEPRLAALVDKLQSQLELRRHVTVRVTSALLAPATVGWSRPVIYLPTAWSCWSDDELRTVLAHELAHVARHDYLSTLVVQFCRAGAWYHPGAWWLAGRARLEQEFAADACAAALSGGWRSYLVNLARLTLAEGGRPALGPAQAFLPTRRALVARVRSLETGLRDPRPVQGRVSWRVGWSLVAAGLGLTLAATGLREPWYRKARAAAPPPSTASAGSDDAWVWQWAPAGAEAAARLGPADIPADERQQHEDLTGLALEQLVPWNQVAGLWIVRHRAVSPGVSTLAPLGAVLPGDPLARTIVAVREGPVELSGTLNIDTVTVPPHTRADKTPEILPAMTGNLTAVALYAPPSLIVIRSQAPIAWAGDGGPPTGDWQVGHLGDRRYWYLNDERGMTTVLALVDEQTIALGDPRELARVWGADQAQPEPPWAEAWSAAKRGPPLLAAQSTWIVDRLGDQRLPGPLAIPGQLVTTLLRGSTWCLIEKSDADADAGSPAASSLALRLMIGFNEPPAEVWAETVLRHARREAEGTLQGLERETAELAPESRARWAEEAALARRTIDQLQARVTDGRLEVELAGPYLPVVWGVLKRALVRGPGHRELRVWTNVSVEGNSPADRAAAEAQARGQTTPEIDVINQRLTFDEADQVATAREASQAKLRRIGEAVQAYLADKGEYPRPRFDDAGNPLLSWRVMILPYLGEAELFAEFHLDEPWNSPHNRRLLARRPEVYHTPRAGAAAASPDAAERTGYSSAYGTGLMFDGDTPRRPADLADGADQTIFAYQAPRGPEIPWTEPTGFFLGNLRPEEVERFQAWIARATDRLDDTVYQVLMADGSVRGVARNIDTKMLTSLLSISGNDRLNLTPLPPNPPPP